MKITAEQYVAAIITFSELMLIEQKHIWVIIMSGTAGERHSPYHGAFRNDKAVPRWVFELLR
jgi:hypothetical protein